MVNFELVFGNSYNNEPRCDQNPCAKAAQVKAVPRKAGERCCPLTDKKEPPYILI